MNTRLHCMLIALCAIACTVQLYADAAIPTKGQKIAILFTHDLHSYFLPTAVPGPAGAATMEGGYSRLATAISAQRAKYGEASILVDGGDFAEGTLFHTVLPEEALEFSIMGLMGYDATTLGNHDFDFYPEGLANMLDTARVRGVAPPALVASNVIFGDGAASDRLRKAFAGYPAREYLILNRGGIKIGLFGLMGRDASSDTPYAKPITFADTLTTARRMVTVLRNREQVDLVLCLSHSGTREDKSRSEDEILAKKVSGIDVIISGHTHTTLAKPILINNTIIVSAGCYAANLGVLGLKRRGNGGFMIDHYALVPITAALSSDPRIDAKIAEFEKIIERRYLVHFNYGFNQVLAESAFDMETITDLYEHPGETRLGDLVTDSYRYAVKKVEGARYRHVDIAVDPIGTIRSSFVKGMVTVADAFRILSLGPGDDGYPGNSLIAGYVLGRDLRDVMEIHASIGTVKDDAYLQVSGTRFTYNPHRMLFDRVYKVEVQDASGAYHPVIPDRLYRIVLNSFVATMFNYIREQSKGLLTMRLRDEKGAPVDETNIDRLILRNGGVKVKEWVALAWHLQSFRDDNGNGIPDVPDRYRTTGGRIIAAPSWNPIDLLRNPGAITIIAAGIVLLVVGGAVFGFVRVFRRRRKAR